MPDPIALLTDVENKVAEVIEAWPDLEKAVGYKQLFALGYRVGTLEGQIRRELEKRAMEKKSE